MRDLKAGASFKVRFIGGQGPPFQLPHPPPLPHLPSLSSFPASLSISLPFPAPPLEVGPLITARGSES